MKISILLIPLFAFAFSAFGQTTITSAGENITAIDGEVSYSIGQPFYETIRSSQGSLSPGVQQPYEISVVLGDDLPEIRLSLQIYPNPVTNALHLKIDSKDYLSYSYALLNMNGQFLASGLVNSPVTAIQMAIYPSSTYLLKVMKDEKTLKTFRVLKKGSTPN